MPFDACSFNETRKQVAAADTPKQKLVLRKRYDFHPFSFNELLVSVILKIDHAVCSFLVSDQSRGLKYGTLALRKRLPITFIDNDNIIQNRLIC